MDKKSSRKETPLAREIHIKYLRQFLNILPSKLEHQSTSRLLLVFFSVCGLDILNALDQIKEEQRQEIIKWIYSLQILPNDDHEESTLKYCGFKGGTIHDTGDSKHRYESGHLAMTYAALASLIVLGDDLSGINKKGILEGIKSLQTSEGSFCGTMGEESDMRFIYCACCVCYILNDFSAINLSKMIDFITSSVGYDGSIGQGPELESHGGSTFCGLAALNLSGVLNNVFTEQQLTKLRRWCIFRQVDGFQGRPHKPVDTCYSFWVGAALHILGVFDLIDFNKNREYVMLTQNNIRGGFSKWEDSSSDPLHTHLGLSGLSLIGEQGLAKLHPSLNITARAHSHLKRLHEMWM